MFQFMAIAPLPVPGHHCKGSGTMLLAPSDRFVRINESPLSLLSQTEQAQLPQSPHSRAAPDPCRDNYVDPRRASELFIPAPKQGPLPAPIRFHAGSEAQSRPRPRVARELLTHGPAPRRPLSRPPRAGWAGRAGGGGAVSRAVCPVPPRRPSPWSCLPAAAAAPGGAGSERSGMGAGRQRQSRPESSMGRACALPLRARRLLERRFKLPNLFCYF